MKRDPRLYLEDILQAIGAIERYTEGITREDFDGNELVQDGVVRRLEIIGGSRSPSPQRTMRPIPRDSLATHHWHAQPSLS